MMSCLLQGQRKYWTLLFVMVIFVILQVFASVFFLTGNNGNPFTSWKLPLDSEKRSTSLHRSGYSRSRSNRNEISNLSFTPNCPIQSKEALSAISRARSQECKQLIANVSCLIQSNSLIPPRLPRFCPQKNASFTPGKSLGCFSVSDALLLKGANYKLLKTNSPLACLEKCFQAGFSVSGVSNSTLCWCGSHEDLKESHPLPPVSCFSPCPRNMTVIQVDNLKLSLPKLHGSLPDYRDRDRDPSSFDIYTTCGGTTAISVFETGLSKVARNKWHPEEAGKGMSSVRIAFIFTVNGRAWRQIKRLLKNLYSPNHFYYFHVDLRQDYLHRQLLALEKDFENIKVSRKRLPSIWGGASLLKVLLNSIHDLLTLDLGWASFDFVINLSESDFPIKSLERLELFLTANQGRNFVKSHGQDTHKFISKQGLDRSFVECDNHMWRLGRRVLPAGVVWDGGSDWIALSNDFASYLTFANNSLVRGLIKLYEHTLLPAESFFHTVLINSEHCDTVVDNNLHATNWKRRLGCQCQYKKVVDWCGCSPNDFKLEDWTKLQSLTEKDGLYFARKFEPVIDLLVVNKLESWIQDEFANYKLHSDPSYDKYWENVYDREDVVETTDSRLVAYDGMARLSSQFIQSLCEPITHIKGQQDTAITHNNITVSSVTFFSENNHFRGFLVTFDYHFATTSSSLQFESWLKPKFKFKLIRRLGPINRLVSLTACSELDIKEMMFRNLGCIMNPYSGVSLLHEWSISEDVLDDELMNFSITFSWIDPNNVTVVAYEESIGFEASPDTSRSTSLILSSTPNLRLPMIPGSWRVVMTFRDIIVAETSFLVIPVVSSGQEDLSSAFLKKKVATVTSGRSPRQTKQQQHVVSTSSRRRRSSSSPLTFETKKVGPNPRHDVREDESDNLSIHAGDNNDVSKSHDIIVPSSPEQVSSSPLMDSVISSFWSVHDTCLVVGDESEEKSQSEYSLHHHQPQLHREEDGNQGEGEEQGTQSLPKNRNIVVTTTTTVTPAGNQFTEQQNHHHHPLPPANGDAEEVRTVSVTARWICSRSLKKGSSSSVRKTEKDLTFKACSVTPWSSFSPDPKSDIT